MVVAFTRRGLVSVAALATAEHWEISPADARAAAAGCESALGEPRELMICLVSAAVAGEPVLFSAPDPMRLAMARHLRLAADRAEAIVAVKH